MNKYSGYVVQKTNNRRKHYLHTAAVVSSKQSNFSQNSGAYIIFLAKISTQIGLLGIPDSWMTLLEHDGDVFCFCCCFTLECTAPVLVHSVEFFLSIQLQNGCE